MKTNNQFKVSPPVTSRRDFITRIAIAVITLAFAVIPAVADDPPKESETIRPFHAHFSDEALADLRQRVNATRWPEQETVADTSQGVQLATMQKLARYWATDYDWRKVEAKLNALPQFVTTIDGVDIHFIHVRSKN